MQKSKDNILVTIKWSITWVNIWLFFILLSNIGIENVKVVNDYIETKDEDIYEKYPNLYCSSEGLQYFAKNLAPVFDTSGKIKKCDDKNSILYHNGSYYTRY